MTKHLGYEPGDFHFDERHRRTSLAARVLPRLVDFALPLAIGALALYIGRYGFG